MKKKRRDYSKIKFDDIPKVQEPGERVIIKSRVNIDYSVFKKDATERKTLKWLKQQAKQLNNK